MNKGRTHNNKVKSSWSLQIFNLDSSSSDLWSFFSVFSLGVLSQVVSPFFLSRGFEKISEIASLSCPQKSDNKKIHIYHHGHGTEHGQVTSRAFKASHHNNSQIAARLRDTPRVQTVSTMKPKILLPCNPRLPNYPRVIPVSIKLRSPDP